MLTSMSRIVAVICTLLTWIGDDDVTRASATLMASDKHHIRKEEIADVDSGQCLESVEKMDLKYFRYAFSEFQQSHFGDRREIGLLAQEAISVLPDGVAAISELVVSNANSENRSTEEEDIMLQNILVLDPDTVFWTNVGASKELYKLQKALASRVGNMSLSVGDIEDHLTVVDERLDQEAAIDLVERRKIAEEQRRRAELELETARAKGEEERKTAELRAQKEIDHAKYVDELALERLNEDDRRAQARNVDLVRMQKEAAEEQEEQRMENERRLEEMRAETALRVAQMESDAAVEQARVEAEAKIKQERENEDIARRRLAAELEAQRERVLQGIKMTFALLANGLFNYLRSPHQIASTVIIVGLMGLMLQLARAAGTEVARRLAIPSLVRETSKTSGHYGVFQSIYRMIFERNRDLFHGIFLKKSLEQRIRRMGVSIRNTRRHGAPMRHFLFYGPPGTGKTLTARRLAHRAGLDYAIMTGGDVAPLGKEGVTELHKLFKWASSSRRGLLLFIDEAEAFLGTRSGQLSEELRNAVSAILYHTGTQQKTFMLVLATNRPGDLDAAVLDRIDEALEFSIPNIEERNRLVTYYFDSCIRKYTKPERFARARRALGLGTSQIHLAKDMTSKAVLGVAKKTDKFSGREISKLMMAIQAAVYGSEDCKLNAKEFDKLVDELIRDQRKKWSLLSKKTAWS